VSMFWATTTICRALAIQIMSKMALILHIFSILLQVFFCYNFVKIVIETMIIKDDFFCIDCIKWWCYHVHLEEWITIVIITTAYASSGDWKLVGLMSKLCGAISPCFCFLSC
jgi:hypothetical protein